jgi:hypothetical protein
MAGPTAWHCFYPGDDAARQEDAAFGTTPAALADQWRRRCCRRQASSSSSSETPILLLLHANGFGAATYAPLARCLRAHLASSPLLASAPFLAPDMPGQGDSSASFPASLGRPLTAGRFAAWLLSALAAQGLLSNNSDDEQQQPNHRPDNPIRLYCFAHSGGAATALEAEAQRPGTFAAIFAYEPVEAPPEVRDQQARGLMLTSAGISKGEPLARMARKRRAVFAGGRLEARASLASKPPFRGLCAEALDLYVQTQLEEVEEVVVVEGVGVEADSTHRRPARLRCAPEVEAEYFQAFSRPPHGWRHERVQCPVALACGGAPGGGLGERAAAAASRRRGGSGGGDDGQHPNQQRQKQQQKEEGPHDALAAWAPLTARALVRGEMHPPFARLGHLGPLEDPDAVGKAAAAFFLRARESSSGSSSTAAARSRL